MARMPLEPPHSTTQGTITERLLHVPVIPQQNMLIIAAKIQDIHTVDEAVYHLDQGAKVNIQYRDMYLPVAMICSRCGLL